MKYRYFIHYEFGTNEGRGIGNTEVERTEKIKNIADIIEIEKDISTKQNDDWVHIKNFILFED